MTAVELTLLQLAGVVAVAVILAVTDGTSLSRIGVAWTAKKLGVSPGDVYQYDTAAGQGEEVDDADTDE